MDPKLKKTFWTDPRIEEADKDVKLAVLWLISNPASDLCGFTQVSNKRFVFETGLDASALEGACKGLPSSIQPLSNGVYFLRNFLRHQFGKGGRLKLGNHVVTAAVRHACQLPEEQRSAFFDAYPELLELADDRVRKDQSTKAPSKPLTQKPEGVREGKEKALSDSSKRIPDIIAIYPKREKDHDATLELARQIERGEVDIETVAAGTRAIAAIIPRLSGGHLNRYVPSALAFFRDRRWQDDPQTWLRNAPTTRNGAPPPEELDLGGRRGTTVKIPSTTTMP